MANILGINTGGKGWSEAKSAIGAFYISSGFHLIVTPNPEIILSALEDEELFYILNQADLSLADGFGLKIAAALSKQRLERVTGADILPWLLEEAAANRRRIVIINRADGLSNSEDIKSFLSKYDLEALVIDSQRQEKPTDDTISLISGFKPALAICLLGSPYQEKFLFHLGKSVPTLKVAAGLGGAFDFLTGKSRRAPILLRRMGLEWLWRWLRQPKRVKRIYRATFVFLSKLFHWLYVLPRQYRPNVAVLLYRNAGREKEILIVERQGQNGHWQLPQGGLDGLSIEEAGKKELWEETGAKTYRVSGVYPKLYRYDFDKESGKYANPKGQKHFGYRGQEQSLLLVEFLGGDEEIKINFWDHQAWRWVSEDKLISALHPVRRTAAALYLDKLKAIR